MARNLENHDDPVTDGGYLIQPNENIPIRLETLYDDNTAGQVEYNKIPDECPICHHGIDVRIKLVYRKNFAAEDSQIIFQCPRKDCLSFFIGYYKGFPKSHNPYILTNIAPKKHLERDFKDIIMSISPQISLIYNESSIAEQLELTQICGVGYRKALEFLIKDYAIYHATDNAQKEDIKSNFLSDVIRDHIDNQNIQDIASRATWLGNDETHYIRKWIDKDINDLKILIELTIRWIELVEMSSDYKNQMPSTKNK
jgi:hypothetical protein